MGAPRSWHVLGCLLVCLALSLAPGAVPAGATSAAPPGHRAKPFDLDGDGHGELAVGEPWSRGGGKASILRGTSNGVTATGSQEITQDTPGVAGLDEGEDYWGRAVSSGDFDRDGYADLVVGALQENWLDDDPTTGAVTIIRGGPGGAPGHGSRTILATNPDDIWGGGLAVGDLDGDGYDDLVISAGLPDAPGERDDSVISAQHLGVTVIYGSPSGLDTSRTVRLTAQLGTPEGEHTSGKFGEAIAVGDVTGDGKDDLVTSYYDASGGGTYLYRGRAGLISTTADQVVPDVGIYLLALGDFDGDGFDDLAGDSQAAGGTPLYLYPGTASGFDQSRRSTVSGIAHPGGSGYGFALAAGDVNADGRDDLVFGDPSDNVGHVDVLEGSRTGLSDARRTRWTQATPGVPGVPEHFDECGIDVRVADVGRSSVPDLIATCGGENEAGGVMVLYGHVGTGLSGTGSQLWLKSTPGVVGVPGPMEGWGKLDQ